jgi:hypothetical protein
MSNNTSIILLKATHKKPNTKMQLISGKEVSNKN